MRLAALITLTAFASGCGTIINLAPPLHILDPSTHLPMTARKAIYGGVRYEVEELIEFARSEESESSDWLAIVPLACIDLPLTAAADTMTLPITVHAKLNGYVPPPFIIEGTESTGPFSNVINTTVGTSASVGHSSAPRFR
jgi:uncharacterized protein YceK